MNAGTTKIFPNLEIIVAMSKNMIIGKDNQIPWSDTYNDLKLFNSKTIDNIVIMGRYTYSSIPRQNRPLLDRMNVVVYKTSVPHINQTNLIYLKQDDVIKFIENTPSNKKIFVIGGSIMYEYLLPYVFKLNISYIHENYDGDKSFPEFCGFVLNSYEDISTPNKKVSLLNYYNIHYILELFQLHKYINLNTYPELFVIKDSIWASLYLSRIGNIVFTTKNNYEIQDEFLHNEYQYLDLLESIMNNGEFRDDRTGTGTISVFGKQLRFNIAHTIPLLTTKFVSSRNIILELLWILQGKTDAKILSKQGVKIWDGNTSADFLKKRKLDYVEGDVGAMYGYQLRHMGKKYIGCSTDYNNYVPKKQPLINEIEQMDSLSSTEQDCGDVAHKVIEPINTDSIDQLMNVIHLLKTDPFSRRIMMTTYNPPDLEKGVLHPCHGIVIQFYVNVINEKKYLSLHMYQRSADCFLGLPYNIASYSIMNHIIAKLVGMSPYELIISIGDAHIYKNHIEQCKLQIKRVPHPQPILEIKDFNSVEELTLEHFNIIGYLSHPAIKAEMSV